MRSFILSIVLAAGVTVPAVAQDGGGRVRFLTNRDGRVLPLTDEEDGFVFAVLGDRTGGPAEGIEVLRQAVGEVNLFEPDLVMTVGDLVQGYNTREPWLRQMKEFRSVMDGLAMPWFPVAGNHDVYWRGEGKPVNEHESDYETYFGPLWYAFRHKNAWFIALYSDEGNPETGEKSINDPEAQHMSPEQFAWIESILERASGADHVFAFLHHPRWTGGAYGTDWDRVHRLLVDAGNVTAVFAGHIHRMRYDAKDGIEYITLATTGGAQSHVAERAGYLHHFDIVTVRPDHIAIATVPVGAVFDPRAVTADVSAAAGQLARMQPTWTGRLEVARNGGVSGEATIVIENPTDRPLDVEVIPTTDDTRWQLQPDHAHLHVLPNASASLAIAARRGAGAIDDAMRWPEVELGIDYLGEGIRVPIPRRQFRVAMEADPPPAPPAPDEQVLALDGGGVRIEAFEAPLPQGAMTVEAWARASRFDDRVGLINNTENSGFGLFVGNGRPAFMVHLDGRYRTADAEAPILEPNRWYHLAGVYDGAEVRMYVDGHLIARAPGSGARRNNPLPTFVGADVDGSGDLTSPFMGWMDEVRISSTARYIEDFAPARRFEADGETQLLLHCDGHWGPWLHDASGAGRHGVLVGAARIRPGTGG